MNRERAPSSVSVCARTTLSNSVPEGRLTVAQDVSPGCTFAPRSVPEGRLKITQDAILGYLYLRIGLAVGSGRPRTLSWDILSRPYGTGRCPRTYPGLTSWATLSRPCGTELWTDPVLTQIL